MGRDIRVESKHLIYRGSKSSDLLMAFDLFFSYFPEYDIGDGIYFNINLSRNDMKRVLDFIKNNSKFYRNADELFEQINNIYIRMMPKDFVEINIW
jgi:hypothetical protein